jgi:amino acid permease
MSEPKVYDSSDLEKREEDGYVTYHDGLEPKAAEQGELQRTLKNRHVQMISIGKLVSWPDWRWMLVLMRSLGGVIGTGELR